MLIILVICIFGMVVNGEVNLNDVLFFIGLVMLGYLVILLCVMFFILVLLVLMCWYKDFEMVVWFILGISLMDFICLVLCFLLLFIVLVVLLVLFGWLWVN